MQVRREGRETSCSTPKQLVFATGSYGPPREVSICPAEGCFAGVQYHSGQPSERRQAFRGKRCIVVGRQQFRPRHLRRPVGERSAAITMIQRTPTTVVRSETLMDVAFARPLLRGGRRERHRRRQGRPDLRLACRSACLRGPQRPLYAEIARRDADLIAAPQRGGLPDRLRCRRRSGLMMKALRTGSGYYIDVGCSELIASGEVKVRSGVEIARAHARAPSS